MGLSVAPSELRDLLQGYLNELRVLGHDLNQNRNTMDESQLTELLRRVDELYDLSTALGSDPDDPIARNIDNSIQAEVNYIQNEIGVIRSERFPERQLQGIRFWLQSYWIQLRDLRHDLNQERNTMDEEQLREFRRRVDSIYQMSTWVPFHLHDETARGINQSIQDEYDHLIHEIQVITDERFPPQQASGVGQLNPYLVAM
jgi:hypothetical protein